MQSFGQDALAVLTGGVSVKSDKGDFRRRTFYDSRANVDPVFLQGFFG